MKLNKRIVTVGLLILAVAIVLKVLWIGLSKIKIDDFKPAGVVFVIDSSASNQQKLPEQMSPVKPVPIT